MLQVLYSSSVSFFPKNVGGGLFVCGKYPGLRYGRRTVCVERDKAYYKRGAGWSEARLESRDLNLLLARTIKLE